MRLDRNLNKQGKYILIKARELEKHTGSPAFGETDVVAAMRVLEKAGLLVYSTPGSEDEFFVIKLKDKYAAPALYSYMSAVLGDPDTPEPDKEYAGEIEALGDRAGVNSPWCKRPD